MGWIAGYTTPADLNTPTSYQERATAIKRDVETREREIQAATWYTDDTKKRMRANLYREAMEKVAKLKEEEQTSYSKAIANIERALLGLPDGSETGAIISFRDAVDRVERLPYDKAGLQEALSLLERARISGDESLAKAVLLTSLKRGNTWTEIVDAWAEKNPTKADQLIDYQTLLKFDPSTSHLAYFTYEVKPPSELLGTILRGDTADDIPTELPPANTSGNVVHAPTYGDLETWAS